jgi:hypothetical protein
LTEEALRAARVVWDFHCAPAADPTPSDVIVGFGTNDLRVADFCADLFARGLAPTVVFTGGVAHTGDLLATGWTDPEAAVFARRAELRGVPRARMLLETRALNTAENVAFTREMLESAGVRPSSALLVMKPFMARRVAATAAVRWPELKTRIVAQRMTLDEYFTDDLTPEMIVNIMMGDLQRVWVYGRRGWSTPQDTPPEVFEAFDALVSLGYTKHLIAEK